ncbi:DUF1906 domain-containing protein [Paraburkholderia graminis]|uniref:Rv2525c-like glycoside hydrolase-like domain-containing protein n=1 Tax=Paraburkholderia graminis TaxID=60548 RepID=A0ABD5CBH8_9BURK|nr:DUF1906 domain-containing protein [Paraburkholderia graminis]MDR6202506.1 hypothetical protein [Paraburkholderia graminis]
MPSIIDVSSNCANKASALSAEGVRTIIRYYSRDTTNYSKRLSRPEAMAFKAAGMRLCIVHEGRYGNQAQNFDRGCGVADGAYARTYGAEVIRQPAETCIFFGVDFDARQDEIKRQVIPYFQGIAAAFGRQTGEPDYAIGVYGSGATCEAILEKGLATRAWLAQSTGWAGYQRFKDSDRCTLLQGMPRKVAGINCDPDDLMQGANLGDFAFDGAPAPDSASGLAAMRVNARSGLRLRTGPGVEFPTNRILPFNTTVYPLSTVGAWTAVDLQGDGGADGFVNSAYLTPDALVNGVAGSANAITDAFNTLALIKEGESAEGVTAAKARLDTDNVSPDNSGALLSALLQGAGIDVPITEDAATLTQTLLGRGWKRVSVANQKPGDIGVCDDAGNPMSHEVYLVLEVRGANDMTVVGDPDAMAPQIRYASGNGSMRTSYFLRAT